MGTPENPLLDHPGDESSAARVMKLSNLFRAAAIQDIEIGTVVEVDNLTRFAGVVDAIALKLMLDQAGDEMRIIPPTVSAYLPDLLGREQRKGGYWGKTTENHKAIIIPEDRSIIDLRQREREDVKAMTFLAVRDIVTTGRGNIGAVATTCTVYGRTRLRESIAGDMLLGSFTVRTRRANHDVLDRLLQESQANWARRMRAGLRAAYPAGIPGLGK